MVSDKIDNAVIWATAHWWTSPRPLQPHLQAKFNLDQNEALDVIRAASDAIASGGAHARAS